MTADATAAAATTSSAGFSGDLRLHPLTLLLAVVRLGPQTLNVAPALLGLGIAGGWKFIGPALAAFIILSLLFNWAAWTRFHWRVDGDAIAISSGVFSRNHRTIPFDRIQDVNIEQGLVARALGLAKVTLETGSAGSAGKANDGTLDAIGMDQAGALRDLIRLRRAGAAMVATQGAGDGTVARADDPQLLFRITPQRLLAAGLFNFSLAIFAVLFGFLQTFDDVLPFDPFAPEFWADLVAGTALEAWVEAHRWLTVVGGALALALLGMLTGVARTVLRDWDFTLERTASGFRRQRGLTTRTDVAIPINRVQAALIESGWIRRRFGWYALKVQSLASDGKNEPDHLLLPFATLPEIDGLLAELGLDRAGLEERADGWRGVHPAVILGSTIVGAAMVIGAIVMPHYISWFDEFGVAQTATRVAILLSAMLLLIGSYVGWRRQRWRYVAARLHLATGFFSPRHLILPARNVQSADIGIGPLLRRFGLARLRLGVAGGGSEHALAGIAANELRDLRGALLAASR
jgi:putative membrane protein